jgi:hypothetical protein
VAVFVSLFTMDTVKNHTVYIGSLVHYAAGNLTCIVESILRIHILTEEKNEIYRFAETCNYRRSKDISSKS